MHISDELVSAEKLSVIWPGGPTTVCGIPFMRDLSFSVKNTFSALFSFFAPLAFFKTLWYILSRELVSLQRLAEDRFLLRTKRDPGSRQ
jgi:hypothetical protein